MRQGDITQIFTRGVVAGTALTLAIATALGTGHTDPPGVVTGSAFKLVDHNGKVRGSWDVEKDEASLEMSDTKGRTRVGILVKDNPTIKLWGEKAQNAVVITQDETGSWFIMCDNDGRPRLNATANNDTVYADIRDQNNKPRIDAIHRVNNDPVIHLLTKDGGLVWMSGNNTQPGASPKPAQTGK